MSMRNNRNSTQKMTIAESLRLTIRQEMERDKKVFCIGEDIGIKGGFGGAFTVTLGLSEQFGHERILDTPISETGIAGVAIGAALSGMRPIADVQYSDFLFCAMDQLVNQAAKLRFMSGGKLKVPMVMRAPGGATTSGPQHSQSLESYFLHVPGLKVACPSTAYDAKGLLTSAIRDDSPVLFFEHKLLYGSKGNRAEKGSISPVGEVPLYDYTIPFGKAKIRKKGKDVTILGKLRSVYTALEASKTLEQRNISCEVIDPRTIVPFDSKLLFNSVKKTGRLVIVDECTKTGGWAGEISALVQENIFEYLKKPVVRVTAPDTPVPFAPKLENFFIPQAKDVVKEVLKLF